MKLVFLGPPGAGKGTQAKLLAEKQGLAHLSTGDMLRQAVQAGTALGKRVKDIMDSGQLVSDELIIELMQERMSQSDCAKGYILDGFPRTVKQAEALGKMLASRGSQLSGVILFEVTEADLHARLANRRGAEARADDNEATQRERIRIYNEQTAPLIDYYENLKSLHRVPSSGTVPEVQSSLERVLKALQSRPA